MLGTIYPNRCVCCREPIGEGETLCTVCYNSLKPIDSSRRCMLCGHEKKDCVCKIDAYHFAALVAPFYNEGLVHDAIIGYKYHSRLSAVRFFAERLALCVKNEYRDISFDAVCFAPTTNRSRRNRGFDQSELLARRVAKLLDLPFYEKALSRKVGFFYRSQHKQTSKERFQNVRGTFRCDERLPNKTVLLIDDIKTTGASLDEAARTLLFGGAREVYAAAIAITPFDLTKKEGEDHGNGYRN